MQLTVRELREALALLIPFIPKRTTLPILHSVLVHGGRAIATDMDVSAVVRLTSDGHEPMLLPPSVAETLRYIPGDTPVVLTTEKSRVLLRAGGTGMAYTAGKPEDYPPIPTVEEGEGAIHGVLSGDRFVESLLAVLPCAAGDDSRPVLQAVLVHSTEEGMTTVAADGYRMAYHPTPMRLGEPGLKLLLSTAAVRKLARLWKAAAVVDVSAVESVADLVGDLKPLRVMARPGMLIQFSFGKVTMVSRPVQGSYPNYEQMIPKEHGEPVTCWAEELGRAVRQASEIAAASEIVRLAWVPGRMTVSARAEEGELSVEVPVETSGQGFIAFKERYLSMALKGLTGSITLLTTTPQAPAVLRRGGAPDMVLMPMFVQQGQPAPAPQKPQKATQEGQGEAQTPTEASQNGGSPQEAPASQAGGQQEGKVVLKEARQRGPKTGNRRGKKPA